MIRPMGTIHGERGIGISRVLAVVQSNGHHTILTQTGKQASHWMATVYKSLKEGGFAALFFYETIVLVLLT